MISMNFSKRQMEGFFPFSEHLLIQHILWKWKVYFSRIWITIQLIVSLFFELFRISLTVSIQIFYALAFFIEMTFFGHHFY